MIIYGYIAWLDISNHNFIHVLVFFHVPHGFMYWRQKICHMAYFVYVSFCLTHFNTSSKW